MRKMRSIILILMSVVLLTCRDTSTEPTVPQPGKRDYTWTVDTLSYPGSFQTLMRDIWASSPTDVYVVGHNDQNRGQMYHYDGQQWSAVHLAATDGGTIVGPFDLSAVYGFSSTDVWAVGEKIYTNPTPLPNFLDSSLIIHFDGSVWREVLIYPRERTLVSIWGARSTDIWFGGSWGSLYHYDGASTSKISFDTLTSFAFMTGFSASNMYATCARKIDFASPEDSSFYLLNHYDGNYWTPIDSFIVTPNDLAWKFGLSLWGSENGKLYSATYGAYLLESGVWRQLLVNDWPVRITGSSEQNIFAVGGLGRIFHWNGIDWKRLTEIEDQSKILTGVWTNNVTTFIVGHDGLKTFVIHGK